MSELRPPARPHPRTAEIIGKFAVGRDRLRVYEDVIARQPTPRMFESAHTDIADGLAYTIDGVLIAINRTASSNPAGLSVVYPFVKQAANFPIPTETELRKLLAALPTETRLRDVIDTRRRSVHNYASVEYVSPDVVAEAHRGVMSFWAAATIVVYPITGPVPLAGAFGATPGA